MSGSRFLVLAVPQTKPYAGHRAPPTCERNRAYQHSESRPKGHGRDGRGYSTHADDIRDDVERFRGVVSPRSSSDHHRKLGDSANHHRDQYYDQLLSRGDEIHSASPPVRITRVARSANRLTRPNTAPPSTAPGNRISPVKTRPMIMDGRSTANIGKHMRLHALRRMYPPQCQGSPFLPTLWSCAAAASRETNPSAATDALASNVRTARVDSTGPAFRSVDVLIGDHLGALEVEVGALL